MSDNTETLYRFFDEQDRLLYVGISKHWFERFCQHQVQKEWFALVVRSTMKHFSTRVEAKDAEEEAIRYEKPIFNVLHNNPSQLLDSTPVGELPRIIKTSNGTRFESKKDKRARRRVELKEMPLVVDKNIKGIIKKIKSKGLDVASVVDSLLLCYLCDKSIIANSNGVKFKSLGDEQTQRIKVPVNFDVRNKPYHSRNDLPKNEIISDMLTIYAANNYKIPENE